jgi:hypothetical protein
MKKGIELSLNFIVVIVIALTLFMFGVRFIYNLASEATDLQTLTLTDLDNKIGQLLCDSSDRVCIGQDREAVKRGNFVVFGIKITNIQDRQDFLVTVERPTPGGYTKNNQGIYGDKLTWKPLERTINIGRNEEKELGIGIEVPKDAQAGTYIFDVRVEPYGTLHKLYIEAS